MPDLDISELDLDLDRYAEHRRAEVARMVAIRRARRVAVGPQVSLEFENAETLLHQVQEMAFAERVTEEAVVLEELEMYRRLLPTERSVCATMFVELRENAAVRRDLDELAGIQHAVRLRLGDAVVAGEDVPPDQPDEQTYSVHFLRFTLDGAQRSALADLARAATLRIEHPAYRAEAALPAELRAQLLGDLAST